jgi:hypothetical protein
VLGGLDPDRSEASRFDGNGELGAGLLVLGALAIEEEGGRPLVELRGNEPVAVLRLQPY